MSPVLLSSLLVHVLHEQVVCCEARPSSSRTVDVLHSSLSHVQSNLLYAIVPASINVPNLVYFYKFST